MCGNAPGGILGAIQKATGKGGAPVLSSGGVASYGKVSPTKAMSAGPGRKRAAKLPQVPLLGSIDPTTNLTG